MALEYETKASIGGTQLIIGKATPMRSCLCRFLFVAVWFIPSPGFPLPAETPASGQCLVYPSPSSATGDLAAAFWVPAPGRVEARIYNTQGDLVSVREETLPAGLQEIHLYPSRWQPGLYMCRVVFFTDTAGRQALKGVWFVIRP
jgi:hypothetical protein